MVVDTIKENLCVNKLVATKKEVILVEGDMIVPDSKPDILNTICTSGVVCIYKKEILDDKVRIDYRKYRNEILDFIDEYDIDIMKVIYMLAVHELEETIIGDLTHKQISSEDKKKIGHEAVEKILSELLSGEEIKELIYEFDEGKTKEAKFAYHCDKLECDLQCKLYDEGGFVRVEDQLDSDNHREDVMESLRKGESTWSYNWMNYDRPKYEDDDNFMEVLDYAIDNKISKED